MLDTVDQRKRGMRRGMGGMGGGDPGRGHDTCAV